MPLNMAISVFTSSTMDFNLQLESKVLLMGYVKHNCKLDPPASHPFMLSKPLVIHHATGIQCGLFEICRTIGLCFLRFHCYALGSKSASSFGHSFPSSENIGYCVLVATGINPKGPIFYQNPDSPLGPTFQLPVFTIVTK